MKARPKLTRREKREQKKKFWNKETEEGDSTQTPLHELDLTATDLRKLQEEDSTLVAVRLAADGTVSTAGKSFIRQDGRIYRQYTHHQARTWRI